jgi:high affinity sulfate transporter 1
MEWLRKDLAAGLSVAALALPVGIAYSGLVGFPPVVGLYATVFPMALYALFGSSKQLVIGVDSATCMLVAAALAPFVSQGMETFTRMSVILCFLVGIFCILGGVLHLGFLVDFLSKPILAGFLNGLTFVMISSQLGKIFGIKVTNAEFFETLADFFNKVSQTHVLTLIIGLSALALLFAIKMVSHKIPGPRVVASAAIAVMYLLFENSGVAVVGVVQAGFPPFSIPSVALHEISRLVPDALSIVLICYCSAMITCKGFATRNGYEIDANKEFIALGASNLMSGINSAFVVSGTDSRTAVSDTMGGKSQLTGIFASIVVLVVMLFFMAPVSQLPLAVLGAIIISSAFGLFDLAYLKRLYIIDKPEFYLSVATSLAVMSLGALSGVAVAIVLAMLRLIKRSAKPTDAILGKVDGIDSYQDVSEFKDAKFVPGILIFRYSSAIIFYNADHFRDRVRKVVFEANRPLNWLMIDAESVNFIDSTGNDVLEELINELNDRKIKVVFARTKKQFRDIVERSGVAQKIGSEHFYSSVRTGVEAFHKLGKTESSKLINT